MLFGKCKVHTAKFCAAKIRGLILSIKGCGGFEGKIIGDAHPPLIKAFILAREALFLYFEVQA
jgi:hypothetical protein